MCWAEPLILGSSALITCGGEVSEKKCWDEQRDFASYGKYTSKIIIFS